MAPPPLTELFAAIGISRILPTATSSNPCSAKTTPTHLQQPPEHLQQSTRQKEEPALLSEA